MVIDRLNVRASAKPDQSSLNEGNGHVASSGNRQAHHDVARLAMAVRRGGRRRMVIVDGPDPVDIYIGARLRLARHLAGISQTELGDGLGISFQAVQKYERGENRISASRLFAAARIVNQSVSYFFDDIKDAPAAKVVDSFSNDEIGLIRSFRLLSDDALRRQLVEMTKLIGSGADRRAHRRGTAPSKRR